MFSSGNNYQEILYEEHYDYCRDDVITPPPLPPRKHHSQSSLICQTFPRRRKNLFHHLGADAVQTDSALNKNHQDIFVIQKTTSNTSNQVHRKDLEKFLGVPHFTLGKNSSNKKDLSSFLGVNRKELDRVLKGSIKVDSECGEGSLSTDSSSVWSSS